MSDQNKTVTLTEENFEREVLGSEGPVLVDFWADWCAPCHRIAPVLEELAGDFEGRATIGKVNVDEQTALAKRYGIRSIPALVFFHRGEVVDQSGGVRPKEALATWLGALVEAA